MNGILIQFVRHRDQRYSTVGDWYRSPSRWARWWSYQIRVSKMRDWRYMVLVAVHELVEWALCRHRRISPRTVDRWDLSHLDSDDPGNLTGCPYRAEHLFASQIEQSLAQALEVNWGDYEQAIARLG